MLDHITPLVITFNEERNIERTLQKLAWAKDVVVIDSGSTDRTLELLARYPRVRVLQHPFENFAAQCNFGLAQIASDWVLSLDADYELSDGLVQELATLRPPEEVGGYRARFIYRIYGRPLRGSLYPPRIVLHRRRGALYRQIGHAHRVVVAGAVWPLRGIIFHDDRKPLSRWLSAQRRYAGAEAAYLLGLARPANRRERLRLMGWPAPIAALFYTLVGKGCLLDGWPGWFYALQRVVAEALIALEILDRRLSADAGRDRG